MLTPYQYTYVNFSYPFFSKTVDKFEQDYWGASYKELVKNLKEKYSIEEIRKFKFADCYGGQETLLYYLKKNFGIKRLYGIDERPLQATHVALTNRSFANIRNNPSRYLPLNKKIFGLFKTLSKKPLTPSSEEVDFNVRSRSAKLRYAIRNDNPFFYPKEFNNKFVNYFNLEGTKI